MLLLKNGTFIDWQTLEFKHTDILVEAGLNGGLKFSDPNNPGKTDFQDISCNYSCSDPGRTAGDKPDHQADMGENLRVIDCSGKFITKSFTNGHHHVYSALARGMPAPKKTPENFPEILQYVWWNLDKALDLEMIRASALVTAITCAKYGVTFVIDHHASPNAIGGSLETIAQAFDEVGIGHLLCYEISDRDGMNVAQKGLNETAAYLAKRQGLVGLHASFTVGNDTLKQAVELAKQTDSGIHIHVAEDKSDQDHCQSTYNQRVVERLSDAGVLQFPKTILAHCLHLNDHERGLVGGSDAWVVENMESNLNNSVGFFNSAGLGKKIILGTDGMHSDMLRSARAAFFAGHNFDKIDYNETYRRFRNTNHYLHSNDFKGDGENNLVILDYDSPTPLTTNNFHGHFMFGIESKHVAHVISNGKLIVENGVVLTIDEAKILHESRVQARRLWERMK